MELEEAFLDTFYTACRAAAPMEARLAMLEAFHQLVNSIKSTQRKLHISEHPSPTISLI